MTRGQVDPLVARRHVAAPREAIANLRRHSSVSPGELRANADLRWAVERGLQLCVQNALDIAPTCRRPRAWMLRTTPGRSSGWMNWG